MNKKLILETTSQQDPARVYKVDLSNHHIQQIVLLKQFDKLRCLILNYNLISRLQNLQCFHDLRQLHIESNAIDKLSGLEGNKCLQVLNLRSNRIEKIQNINHLIKLETLIIDHNAVTRLSGLQYLKDLKNLYASHNSIESLQNLPSFSKLQHLSLNHNKISKVPPALFASSKGLISLDLSHNKIANTAFLQQLTSVQQLNLSHNRIKELSVVSLINLEALNMADNELQKLPALGTCFPQLITLNVSSNMICSELDIITALSDTEYLTEVDFRNNPMFSEAFEIGLQKVHNFDFLNGKPMTKAGAKYYEKITKIQGDLEENRQIYGQDDERDRQIKMSGFFNDDLQQKMTGMKVNRPGSPNKKKKPLQKASFYDDIDKTYHQFTANDLRIKVIRQQYLKICGQYNIQSSKHILTQLPAQTTQMISRTVPQEDKVRQQPPKGNISQQLLQSQSEIKKQNDKNLNKWKELKQRQKSFNIRDVIRKSRGKDSASIRAINSATNSNWSLNNGVKPEKMKNELLRTQALPRKVGQDMLKATLRPRSVHKKE